MLRKCNIHGKTDHSIIKRKLKNGNISKNYRCKKCTKERFRKIRKNQKIQLINIKGNKCQVCKQKKEYFIYDFHHIDGKKEFRISKKIAHSLDNKEVKNELKKCLLVCCNCHSKIHGGDENIPEKYQVLKFKKCKEHNINRCIDCHYSNNNARVRRLLTLELINISGNKCYNCMEDSSSCLTFHHVNPKNKKMTISHAIANGESYSNILKEIEKCVLLCQECHRKVHKPNFENKIKMKLIKIKKRDRDNIINKDFLPLDLNSNYYRLKQCKECSKRFKGGRRFYCSTICQEKNKKDKMFKGIEKVFKDLLSNKMNYIKTANSNGISDNGIRSKINYFKNKRKYLNLNNKEIKIINELVKSLNLESVIIKYNLNIYDNINDIALYLFYINKNKLIKKFYKKENKSKRFNIWKREDIFIEAKKHKTYKDFRENNTAYYAAKKRKILDKIKSLFN